MAQIVYSLWQDTLSQVPNKTALLSSSAKVSFLGLSENLATFEQAIPLPEKSLRNRIIMFSERNGVEWLCSFLFCQKYGAIALPLDRDLPAETIQSLENTLCPIGRITKGHFHFYENSKTYKSACLIKLTSGSTGQPKPFFFTDKEMVADCRNIINTMGLLKEDLNLGLIPFGHSYGLGNLVFPLLLEGIPIAVVEDFFPHSLAEDISIFQPTIFPAVPPLFHALASSDVSPKLLRSLRLIISAGSRLNPKTAIAFKEKFNLLIHNFYGSSETGGIAYDASGKLALTGNAIGMPLQNVCISINKANQITVCSDAVYTRYNRHKSDDLGMHVVADSGFIDANGSVVITSRKSNLVKIAGRRLDLREVESALMDLPEVAFAYVATKQNGLEPKLSACVQSSSPREEIIRKLKRKIPKWKCPHFWIFLSEVPLNARGKPDLKKLNDLATNQSHSSKMTG